MSGMHKIKWRSGTSGITYLRVSSRGQVETELDPEGMSLPAQRRKCLDKARQHGLVLVDELIDAGISATAIDQRPSYQELIERVRTDSSISFVHGLRGQPHPPQLARSRGDGRLSSTPTASGCCGPPRTSTTAHPRAA